MIRIVIWNTPPVAGVAKGDHIEHIYEGTHEQLFRADGTLKSRFSKAIAEAINSGHYVTMKKRP